MLNRYLKNNTVDNYNIFLSDIVCNFFINLILPKGVKVKKAVLWIGDYCDLGSNQVFISQ